MENLREFKNYTLLDNITIEGLESLLTEYPELAVGKETTTLNLRYAILPNQASNWTIIEWNSDENLSDEMFFYLHQNILSWLNQSSDNRAATTAFSIAFEEDSPTIPIFFSQVDPENTMSDTTIGIYEEENFSYYLPSGEVEVTDEIDLKFSFEDFLLDNFNFELDWLVDVDSCEWTKFPITLEYDDFL